MSFLTGTVDNGRRATLESTVHAGEVGVRARGVQVELAWFGRPPKFGAATTGTLDGLPIRITGIRARDLVASPSITDPASKDRAIVATAEMITDLAPGEGQ